MKIVREHINESYESNRELNDLAQKIYLKINDKKEINFSLDDIKDDTKKYIYIKDFVESSLFIKNNKDLDCYGYFDEKNNTIYLYKNMSFRLLNTLTHELQHAYDFFISNGKLKYGKKFYKFLKNNSNTPYIIINGMLMNFRK